MVAQLISSTGIHLADLISGRKAKFPASGEQNFEIANPAAALKNVENTLASEAIEITHSDGLSMDFGEWRLNLRPSGTEPLVRLNIESKGDPILVEDRLSQIISML